MSAPTFTIYMNTWLAVTWLWYKALPIHVGLIRASAADPWGNLLMEDEAIIGEVLAIAQAAHNSGGIVLAQVKRLLDALYAAGPRTLRRQSARPARELRRDAPLRHARTCYDHLAGVEGVQLLREMLRRGWLLQENRRAVVGTS